MNLRSIVAIAAVATMGSAMAAYTSNVKLCRVEVTNNYSDVLVSLPMVGVGETTNISPAACVLTNGLQNGDYMYANVDGTRKGWQFDSATAKWKGTPIVSDDFEDIPAAGDDDKIPCGGSVWIHRATSGTSIYLFGQVATNALETSAVASFTMMGNATTNVVKLTAIPWKTGCAPVVGDQIITIGPGGSMAATYTCATNGGASWTRKERIPGEGRPKYNTITYNSENSPEFSPGEGFYFKRIDTNDRTIQWR